MFSKIRIIIFAGIIFLSLPILVNADEWGQKVNFFIDPSFDSFQREELSATLQARTLKLYFYIDDSWWNSLNGSQQDEIRKGLNSLTIEFESKIYPILTSTFGSEAKPGIDKDERITILIHPMIDDAGGYFNNADGYPKAQFPTSNQREMVYLNAKYINTSQTPSLLAHEFMHLITLNQKEKKYNVSEEIWLNEARSEYAPTLLGYDDNYKDSNLQKRLQIFLNNSNNSLTDWRGENADYGVINLFVQYLVDHYGIEILVDSLQSQEVGISSLDFALEKNGFKEDFSQVFTDWTIANLVNDCDLGPKYCYLNQNLKDFRIVPLTNYLPFIGESTFKFGNATQAWSGNWHRFIGGKGELKLEFTGSEEVNFKIPYIIETSSGDCSINFLELGETQKNILTFSDFGTKIISLTIIPTIQDKTLPESPEPYFAFFWTVSITKKENQSSEKPISEMTKEEILDEIAKIKALLAQLQSQLQELLLKEISCQRFEENLFYGLRNDDRVRCLQEFLKSQGSEIYPEGLITGNFLTLTEAAVIRFQEKYTAEILAPLDLQKGTGYVGAATRTKINELLGL